MFISSLPWIKFNTTVCVECYIHHDGECVASLDKSHRRDLHQRKVFPLERRMLNKFITMYPGTLCDDPPHEFNNQAPLYDLKRCTGYGTDDAPT